MKRTIQRFKRDSYPGEILENGVDSANASPVAHELLDDR